jgi:hypothetical protein
VTAATHDVPGRLDGVGVVAGMLLGVVLFNAAFDRIAWLYDSTPLGAVTFTDLMGVSRGVGVALVTAVALAGFFVASTIERKSMRVAGGDTAIRDPRTMGAGARVPGSESPLASESHT